MQKKKIEASIKSSTFTYISILKELERKKIGILMIGLKLLLDLE